jgi:hypothetical protein
LNRRSKARVTFFNSDTGNARSLKPILHKQKRRFNLNKRG